MSPYQFSKQQRSLEDGHIEWRIVENGVNVTSFGDAYSGQDVDEVARYDFIQVKHQDEGDYPILWDPWQ